MLAPLVAEGETLIGRRELTYDALILAVGSQANDYGTPGVADHCYFIDSQAEAESFNIRLRAQVMRSMAQKDHLRVVTVGAGATGVALVAELRSEEHTSELQSLMRISYAVICLKIKKPQLNEKTQY